MDLSNANPADYDITEGCIAAILRGVKPERPKVQLLDHKEIVNKGGGGDATNKRYRLLINDGRNTYPFAMISSQVCHLVDEGVISKFSIVELETYVLNTPANDDKKILIITSMSVYKDGNEDGGKIGSPAPMNAAGIVERANGNQNPHVPQQAHLNPLAQAPGKRPFAGANGNMMDAGDSPKRGPAVQQFGGNQHVNVYAQASSFPGGNLGASPGRTPRNYGSMLVDNEGFEAGGPMPQNVCPISVLTPYQNKWTIRAVVKSKDQIREWSNAKGNGKVFGMWLKDESGEMKASAFGAEVDKFYTLIQEGKAYYIRGGTIKTADARFSRGNAHELTFRAETLVRLCEDDVALPPPAFKFVKINQIQALPPSGPGDKPIDVVGIIKNVGDIFTGTSKANKNFTKRDVEIMDDTGCIMKLTVWNEKAEKFSAKVDDVIAVDRCRISDFGGGRSVSASNDSTFMVNTNLPEITYLTGWYNTVGKNVTGTSISASVGVGGQAPFKSIEEASAEVMKKSESTVTFTTRATILKVNRPDTALYKACSMAASNPTADGRMDKRQCNKKIVDSGLGETRCEKCGVTGGPTEWRYMISVEVADFSANAYVTLFQEQAEKILGRKSDEMGQLWERDKTAFQNELNNLQFKTFMFKMKAAMSVYNDATSLKFQVNGADKVDSVVYTKVLTDAFQNLGLGA